MPFSEPQLQQLLGQARAFNARHGLTGILLYGQDQFFQVLEGDQLTVHALYARIQQDPRHRDVTTLVDKAIAQRSFADWSMAYHTLPPAQFIEFAGYVSPTALAVAQEGLSPADTQLLQLLRTFLAPAPDAG
ncbi:BLUF domain-containing protein [Hymenobacter sp. BRD128]|nr:BLUF domain-containing protein [Hymenobacter sp. BRD128]